VLPCAQPAITVNVSFDVTVPLFCAIAAQQPVALTPALLATLCELWGVQAGLVQPAEEGEDDLQWRVVASSPFVASKVLSAGPVMFSHADVRARMALSASPFDHVFVRDVPATMSPTAVVLAANDVLGSTEGIYQATVLPEDGACVLLLASPAEKARLLEAGRLRVSRSRWCGRGGFRCRLCVPDSSRPPPPSRHGTAADDVDRAGASP
jgi:hypothetical protein